MFLLRLFLQSLQEEIVALPDVLTDKVVLLPGDPELIIPVESMSWVCHVRKNGLNPMEWGVGTFCLLRCFLLRYVCYR